MSREKCSKKTIHEYQQSKKWREARKNPAKHHLNSRDMEVVIKKSKYLKWCKYRLINLCKFFHIFFPTKKIAIRMNHEFNLQIMNQSCFISKHLIIIWIFLFSRPEELILWKQTESNNSKSNVIVSFACDSNIIRKLLTLASSTLNYLFRFIVISARVCYHHVWIRAIEHFMHPKPHSLFVFIWGSEIKIYFTNNKKT